MHNEASAVEGRRAARNVGAGGERDGSEHWRSDGLRGGEHRIPWPNRATHNEQVARLDLNLILDHFRRPTAVGNHSQRIRHLHAEAESPGLLQRSRKDAGILVQREAVGQRAANDAEGVRRRSARGGVGVGVGFPDLAVWRCANQSQGTAGASGLAIIGAADPVLPHAGPVRGQRFLAVDGPLNHRRLHEQVDRHANVARLQVLRGVGDAHAANALIREEVQLIPHGARGQRVH